jgi:hypothetical protein
MVEKILVKGQLTSEMIEAGHHLLTLLKEANYDVAAAYWLYNSDAGEWRLTLAMADVDSKGSREVYSKIWTVLNRTNENYTGLDLSNITVVTPNDRLVRALAWISRDDNLSNVRFPDSVIDDVYVEGLYLYFVRDTVKPLRGSSWHV